MHIGTLSKPGKTILYRLPRPTIRTVVSRAYTPPTPPPSNQIHLSVFLCSPCFCIILNPVFLCPKDNNLFPGTRAIVVGETGSSTL
jgi:hypothetical protein